MNNVRFQLVAYPLYKSPLKHEPSSVRDENKENVLYRLGTKGKIKLTEILVNVSKVIYIYGKQPGRKINGIPLLCFCAQSI